MDSQAPQNTSEEDKQPHVEITDHLRRNFALAANGAELVDFTSQYHHGCVVHNLLTRDYTACWFTSANLPLPQSLVLDLGREVWLRRVGIYMHGENGQNVREFTIRCGGTRSCPERVLTATLRRLIGMHLFDLQRPVKGRYLTYEISKNFEGSGAFTTRLYAFGVPTKVDGPNGAGLCAGNPQISDAAERVEDSGASEAPKDQDDAPKDPQETVSDGHAPPEAPADGKSDLVL